MGIFSKFYDRNFAKIWYTYFQLKKKLGFLENPDDVQWLATVRCNLRCEHCGTDAGKPDPDELTTDEIIAVIDDLAILGITYLTLTGGEPLIREDLFEVLNYAAKKRIQYNIVTNSTLVKKYAEEFTKLPPAAIKVSIDGTPETHAKIRGDENNFEDCINALTFFRDLGIETRCICTTLNQRNIDEVPELFKYVLSSDASTWEFHLPIYEGRTVTNEDWIYVSNEQVKWLFEFIIENRDVFRVFLGEGCGHCGPYTRAIYDDRRFFCGCGWTTFTIMPNGNIAGCPAFKNDWIEGNVRESSVLTIWREKFERFRNINQDLDDDCKNCEYLKACLGGCWMMRRTGHHCYKKIWEPGLFNEKSELTEEIQQKELLIEEI